MNELLLSLCAYTTIQSAQGITACQKVLTASYIQSGTKSFIDDQQSYIEKRGAALYSQVPLNQPLGAIFFLGKEIKERDFKMPLTNSINLEYSNFNAYTCNLKWEF